MNWNQEHHATLPITRNLTPIYALSSIIVILMAVASIAGLLCQTTIYPTDELLQSFLPTDVAILVIGLPMLIISLWLTWRGKLVGLLLWPGMLFFVLYNYIVYIFAMPLNSAFLMHLILVMLSTYTLIGLLTSLDGKAVQQRLIHHVPERLTGGVLAGLGLVFFLRVFGILINSFTNHAPIAEVELALHASDFLISPAWVICGVLLWRRKAFGYETGLGMIFQASMLFIGLIILLLIQPLFTSEPFVWVDVVVTFIMGLICFIPFALYVRGAAINGDPPLP
jgi:hypothetical protein